MGSVASVRFDGATRTYPGADVASVVDVDIDIADGELLVVLGGTGAGKSTLLRMLAGLEDIDAGRLYIDDNDVTDLSPSARDVAMVLQSYALYPHLSVAENMGFAMQIAGADPTQIRERVTAAARTLDLEGHLDSRPVEIDRDLRQRVALGRAIVRNPQVFVMDEPLAHLPTAARETTRSQLVALQAELGVTTVYATRDVDEAVALGGRIAMMERGRVVACDHPAALDLPGA